MKSIDTEKECTRKSNDEHSRAYLADYLVIREKDTGKLLYQGRGTK